MGCNWVFDLVLLGQPAESDEFLTLFFDKLSPVPTPSQSGPGLTHYVELGFKTMIHAIHLFHQNLFPHWSFEN
jgi:hypothetical protein